MTFTPSFFSNASRLLPKFLVAVLLQTLAFAATYVEAPFAFSETDLAGIAVLGLAVNVACLLGLLFLLRHGVLTNVVLSLVVLAGVATMHLVHTELYSPENRTVLVAACVATGFALFIAFRVIDEWRWGRSALPATALLLPGIVLGWHAWSVAGEEAADVDMTNITTNIREVSFEETPNLYFVSFDSLIPATLLRKFLDLESTELHALFDKEFRLFPNFFSNAVPTNQALISLLSLRGEIHKQYKQFGPYQNGQVPTGLYPSPLYYMLRNNGYDTNFLYMDRYFGDHKGPYLDNYITVKKGIVCTKLDENLRPLSFWGYCHLAGVMDGSGFQSVVENIMSAGAGDGPQSILASMYIPGHTGKTFHYADEESLQRYKISYMRRSNEAVSYLSQLIDHVEHDDPGSALFVFGDHGTYVSRGLKRDDDPAFYLQDRYGILGGVYPADWCSEYFDESSSKGYMTTQDAVHAILRCLSGGQEVFYGPSKYEHVFFNDSQYRYEDFLYE